MAVLAVNQQNIRRIIRTTYVRVIGIIIFLVQVVTGFANIIYLKLLVQEVVIMFLNVVIQGRMVNQELEGKGLLGLKEALVVTVVIADILELLSILVVAVVVIRHMKIITMVGILIILHYTRLVARVRAMEEAVLVLLRCLE